VFLSSFGPDFDSPVILPSSGASGGVLITWRHSLGPALESRVDNQCLGSVEGVLWHSLVAHLCVWPAGR
jgi:hypothetical protein